MPLQNLAEDRCRHFRLTKELLTSKKLYSGHFVLSPSGKTREEKFFLYQFPFTFFFHLTLYWFFKTFVYLAALGLSWGMQDLVPWSGIEPRDPWTGRLESATGPPGKSLPFTCETNLSFLVLLSPLTWGQKQFAPSNCTPPAFSAQAADFGVQAAYSSSMSSRQTQLFCTWPWHRINAVSFLFQWTACFSGLRLWGNSLSQTTDLSRLSGLLPVPLLVFLRWSHTLSPPCPSYTPAQPWLMAYIRSINTNHPVMTAWNTVLTRILKLSLSLVGKNSLNLISGVCHGLGRKGVDTHVWYSLSLHQHFKSLFPWPYINCLVLFFKSSFSSHIFLLDVQCHFSPW